VMTRSGILSLLWLASALAVVFVGCGATAPSAEQGAAAPKRTLRTTVYFLTDDAAAPLGVRRTVDRESGCFYRRFSDR
jgi:hypothetical protein